MSENWIAVDWGTTNLRAWVMGPDGSIVKKLQSNKGMGSLGPEEFEDALVSLVGPYLASNSVTDVICCGMVGAKQGWKEAPYRSVPCNAPGLAQAVNPVTKDPRINVRILAGVCQSDPADVMRGEETQIKGFLANDPKFDGIICLPGTHTKWAHISAEEIVSFRTFMTGELFSLLSKNSVLRHGMDGAGWDQGTFESGLDDAMGRPQTLGADLFSLRASGLLTGIGPAQTRSRLSGMLIGLELAGSKPYWLGQRVVIIGDPELCKVYQSGLATQGCDAECIDGGDISLAGLASAYFEKPGHQAGVA